MAAFAKVAIESPLPQLDRLFDYSIPDSLMPKIAVGQLVSIPFGRNTKPIEGYVVELADEIEFQGEIAEISSIVSETKILPSNIYQLIRAVADRQAVSFGDVAKTAIPARAVRADKAWQIADSAYSVQLSEPVLQAKLCEPRVISQSFSATTVSANAWVFEAIDLALDAIANGASAIICVPDYRDVELISTFAEKIDIASLITRYGSDQSKTERFQAHLSALEIRPQIVIGTRSALFAPLQNLQHIIIWDDEDTSHYDQSSPYVSSREVALLRQRLESCSLSFLSHARSLALQRLLSIEYLADATEPYSKPTVAFSERDVRVDSLAFNTVRAGLEKGPVLVQVSNLGVAKSAYCKSCATRAICKHCNGPLWIDDRGDIRCRWCNGFNQGFSCTNCQSTLLRMGRAGSTRTAAELGKAFPGVRIIEATGENVVQRVDSTPKLVISTPGAEPQADGGYSAILILDCDVALAKDSLHAREDAVRYWANAIALGSPQAKSALIGLSSDLGTIMANWQMSQFATNELQQRSALGFPPAQRLLSATGDKAKITELIDSLSLHDGVSKLGLAPNGQANEWRGLVRFSYAAGQSVADAVRVFQLKNSGGKRINAKSGQHQRAVTIKIDDPRVL